MSIKKLDFNQVRQSKKPYYLMLQDAAQNITDGFVLGVYCYLSSLPPLWNVNKEHLQKHFVVGRHKITSTLAWLHKNKLLSYHQDRNPDGTVDKSWIQIEDGFEFIENIVKNQQSSTGVPETGAAVTAAPKIGSPDNRVTRKSAPIYNINNIYNNKKRERNKKTSLSTFKPSDQNLELCRQYGLDLEKEIQSFFSPRHKYEKTQEEFQRWLENGHKYKVGKSANSRQEVGKPVSYSQAHKEFDKKEEFKENTMPWGKGHPGWETIHGIKQKLCINLPNG